MFIRSNSEFLSLLSYGISPHTSIHTNFITVHADVYLSSCSSHHQFVAVFAQTNLLNAEAGVVTVGVKTAHLEQTSTNVLF